MRDGPALAAADRAESDVCQFEDCSSKDLLELPYWDAQEFFEIEALPNRYQETSLFARELSDDFIDAMFHIWPATVGAARWTVYRVGGKVNTVAPNATAFVHRSSRWILTTDIDWGGGDTPQQIKDNLTWQRNVHDIFHVLLGRPGSYYNFPDPGLEKPAQAYWGGNLQRLMDVKRRYDPDNVFNPPRNQGIPLA